MSKLVKATKWVKETFAEGSRPTLQEVGEWVEEEQIPGRIIGPNIFIEAERFALGGAIYTPPTKGKLTVADILG